VPHIDEAAWPDVIVVAPATGNSLGKLAAGISDSLPLLVVRAARRATPVIVVPSMNTEMWYDPQLQRSLDLLNETEKYRVLSPTEGEMLRGDIGFGAQVSLEEIVAATYRALGVVGEAIEEIFSRPGNDTGAVAMLVDEDADARGALASAIEQELPGLRVVQFDRASDALAWARENAVSVVVTELTFRDGVGGWELIDYFRPLGINAGVHVLATSSGDRSAAQAEKLARQDVHFQAKPLNVRFVAGLIAGCVRGRRRGVAPSRVRLAAGHVLWEEGDPGSHIYLIESGRIRAVKRDGDREIVLGKSEAGEIIGEVAFFGDGFQSVTVIVDEPSVFVEIDLDDVRGYLNSQPTWLRALIGALAGSLRSTQKTVVTTATRVPARRRS
jgi:ActR/RegA family two-component response regulator